MKKISFGSFCLSEIKKEDRKCLDRYLIKTFSDNISISDAVRNLAITKNLMYITPDALMRDWLGSQNVNRVNRSDRESNSVYEKALKRAFYVMKEFYGQIKNSPFYKEYVYYPIYVEKVERVTSEGSGMYDAKHTDITMNYSFIILSNDLTKSLKIDEIRFDENASLNFLYLFMEFFSTGDMKQSIHKFNKTDYEFLVKLYQFTEKSGKEPIQMVLDLYKIIEFLKKIQNGGGPKDALTRELNKFFDDVEIDDLKRYKGLLRHKFIELIGSRTIGPKSKDDLRRTFIDLMNSIFNSDGLSGLYDGVKPDASRGERHRYLYSTSKYQEVLTLAGELVKYNELKCKDVISNDSLDMDFNVENGSQSLNLQSGVAAQKYQTFFKDYVESIRKYFEGMVTQLLGAVGTQTIMDTSLDDTIAGATVTRNLHLADSRAYGVNAAHHKAAAAALLPGPAKNTALQLQFDNETYEKRYQDFADQSDNFITVLEQQKRKTKDTAAVINRDASAEMVEYLISSMVTNLTFVYDDGKRFFTNELVAKGLLSLHKDHPDLDLTTLGGFEKSANEVGADARLKPKISSGGYQVDNPAFFAASIAKSLQTSFEVMAGDVIVAFSENIEPILRNQYQKSITRAAGGADKTKILDNTNLNDEDARFIKLMKRAMGRLDLSKNVAASKLLDDMRKYMQETIFQNRFVLKVLKNFLRLFEVHEVKEIIQYEAANSQLHPLIKNLLKQGNECQAFKSFIIDHEMVEQLYRLKFITDTQKFLGGITNSPPRKVNDPMSRMKFVLHDALGLQDNPTWVISKTQIFLSMPDNFSLTNTSIFSSIPKADLMKVCNISVMDYWDEKKMGQSTNFGNEKVKKLTIDIAKINDRIQQTKEDYNSHRSMYESEDIQLQDGIKAGIEANLKTRELIEEAGGKGKGKGKGGSKSKYNNKPKSDKKRWDKSNSYEAYQKTIRDLQKQIDTKEEAIRAELERANKEDAGYSPNMNIFNDPFISEREPLISEQENKELMKNKEDMRTRLMDLNPYDDGDVQEMERNQDRIQNYQRVEHSHPFDFEDRGYDRDRRDQRPPDNYHRDERAGDRHGPPPGGGQGQREAPRYQDQSSQNPDWARQGTRSPQNSWDDRAPYNDRDSRDGRDNYDSRDKEIYDRDRYRR